MDKRVREISRFIVAPRRRRWGIAQPMKRSFAEPFRGRSLLSSSSRRAGCTARARPPEWFKEVVIWMKPFQASKNRLGMTDGGKFRAKMNGLKSLQSPNKLCDAAAAVD